MSKNVEFTADGNKLIITIDTSKNFGPSHSGKTIVVASTEGFSHNPAGLPVSINMNVTKGR